MYNNNCIVFTGCIIDVYQKFVLLPTNENYFTTGGVYEIKIL